MCVISGYITEISIFLNQRRALKYEKNFLFIIKTRNEFFPKHISFEKKWLASLFVWIKNLFVSNSSILQDKRFFLLFMKHLNFSANNFFLFVVQINYSKDNKTVCLSIIMSNGLFL